MFSFPWRENRYIEAVRFVREPANKVDNIALLMALRAEVENKQAVPNSGERYVDLSYYNNAMKLVAR